MWATTRRAVLIALIMSVGPCLLIGFPVLVFVDHEPAGAALQAALIGTAFLFIGQVGLIFGILRRHARPRV